MGPVNRIPPSSQANPYQDIQEEIGNLTAPTPAAQHDQVREQGDEVAGIPDAAEQHRDVKEKVDELAGG